MFIDRWIDRLEGHTSFANPRPQVLLMILAKIKQKVPQGGKVLLTGSCDIALLQVLAQELRDSITQDGPQFEIGANICIDAETFSKAEKADGVVIVEKRGKSTFVETDKELELLRAASPNLLGFIML